tara:strand:+ start:1737 stop:1946 length:210 start_codon:yes stop_codon:yes gene_type:complete
MSDSKKKAVPKKAVEKKVEAPKKAEAPKSTAKTLGDLKKEFVAARKANPEKDDVLRAEYLKNKAILQGK